MHRTWCFHIFPFSFVPYCRTVTCYWNLYQNVQCVSVSATVDVWLVHTDKNKAEWTEILRTTHNTVIKYNEWKEWKKQSINGGLCLPLTSYLVQFPETLFFVFSKIKESSLTFLLKINTDQHSLYRTFGLINLTLFMQQDLLNSTGK